MVTRESRALVNILFGSHVTQAQQMEQSYVAVVMDRTVTSLDSTRTRLARQCTMDGSAKGMETTHTIPIGPQALSGVITCSQWVLGG